MHLGIVRVGDCTPAGRYLFVSSQERELKPLPGDKGVPKVFLVFRPPDRNRGQA
jgi:hypothetical protein